MKVDCEIRFGVLCAQLGVKEIPGATNDFGNPPKPDDKITLPDVKVDDDYMTVECQTCSRCEDDDVFTPPERHYLSDFLTAILAGDVSTARMLVPSVFQDDASVMVCEQVLRSSPLRRVA